MSHDFVNWTLDGMPYSADNPLTVTNVAEDMDLVANFVLRTYTVQFFTDGTPGASLLGTSPQTVTHGSDCTPVTAVAPATHDFVEWTLSYEPYSTDNPLTVADVTWHMTLTAKFGRVVFVKADASGANDGASWTDAYTDLESALSAAVAGRVIWVAAGTYYPTLDHDLGLGDRGRHFRLKNGVAVYGGFAGGETSRSERVPETNLTILSGDIGVEGDTSDNCWHVFYHPEGLDLDGTAVLDGFTVTGGNADGTGPHMHGGGVHNYSSSPTVRDCVFSANAADVGGGMYNYSSSPTVTDCMFHSNLGGEGAGGMGNRESYPTVTDCVFYLNTGDYGGAMSNAIYSAPTVTGCTFDSNSATYVGGGICSDGGTFEVTDCVFVSNTARSGAGMRNRFNSSPVVTNCVFALNNASLKGGGMASDGGWLRVTNCTFALNGAGDLGGAMHNWNTDLVTENCILWGNVAVTSGDAIYNDTAVPVFVYCDVESCGGSGAGWDAALGTDGGGNIDSDPFFANVPLRVDPTSAPGTTTTVEIAGADAGYAVNDVIEIGADGVPRTVTGMVAPSTVAFDPALGGPSAADVLVRNWGPGAVDLTIDLHLGASSPCIDAGDTAALPADAADLDDDGDTTEPLPLDLDGNPRVSGSFVDMGAYEHQE